MSVAVKFGIVKRSCIMCNCGRDLVVLNDIPTACPWCGRVWSHDAQGTVLCQQPTR